MAVNKEELQKWLDTLPDDALVAIDDGGLILVAYNTADDFTDDPTDGPYIEVGGIPYSTEGGEV